jgi:hypothetical protein
MKTNLDYNLSKIAKIEIFRETRMVLGFWGFDSSIKAKSYCSKTFSKILNSLQLRMYSL